MEQQKKMLSSLACAVAEPYLGLWQLQSKMVERTISEERKALSFGSGGQMAEVPAQPRPSRLRLQYGNR